MVERIEIAAASGALPVTVLEVRVVTGTGGGPEKTILSGPRYLDPHGFRTLCAYMHPPEDPGFGVLQRRAESLGATLISIPDRGPFDRSVVRRLQDLCRKEHVAIWHGHDYKSDVLGLWIRRTHPMRLVSTVHGWGVRHWKSPLFDAVDLWSLRRYDRVICVSKDLLESCRRGGVSESRLRLVENGIEVDRFRRRQPKDAARQALGLPVDGLLLGAVGRLSEEKGFDLLIEVVRRLQADYPGLRLVVAGDGPCREALQRQIERSGLSMFVRLLGFRDDVVSVLEALDVFVLSSRREGLPNVVLEAMATEVPVVATRVAGVPHVLTDGRDGLLAEPDDVDSLLAAVRRSLDDASLRDRLAPAGRDTVVRTRSFAVRMDRLREIYEELLRE
jgi:glycosyltransferase involved in cell wall biosynthesis